MWTNVLIRYSLLGYAGTSCIWVGGTYIFIGLGILGAIIKVIYDKAVPHFTEPALLKAIAVFLGAMLLSAIFSDDFLDSLKKVWAYADRMIPMFLVILFIHDRRTLSFFLFGAILSLSIADSIAIWQGFHGDYRAAAFSSHPMIFAGYLVEVIGLLQALIVSYREEFRKYRAVFFFLFGLSIVALFFNGTRGAWLAVTLTVALFSFQCTVNKKKWFSICLLVFLCMGILFATIPNFHDRVITLTDRSFQSNSERMLLWQSSWQMFIDHPLLGIGVGRFYQAYNTQYISPSALEPGLMHAHNNFIQMLADGGLIGFLSFVYLYYIIVRLSYQNYRQNDSIYSLVLILVTGNLLMQGLTEFNFGDSVVIRLYWFIVGIGFSAAAYQNKFCRSDNKLQASIRRILIVKPCALGDMILALPTIRALKCQYPEATIDLMTNKVGAVAAEGNPYIDHTIVLTEADGADSMGKVRGLGAWYRLRKKLKPYHYDLAVSLRYTARNNFMTWLAAARLRIGYAIDGTDFFLTHSCPNLTKQQVLPDMDYGTALLKLIGVDKVDTKLEFSIRDEVLSYIDQFISENGRKKIALNIYSGKGRHRSLSEANIIKVITYASSLGDIYLVGSNEEKGYLDEIIKSNQLAAVNMAGKCSFMQSGALLSKMDLFISTDGGALHLGRSVGVPVIALLGDSSSIQWGTHEPQSVTLAVKRACAPCRITKMPCTHPEQCLDSLIDDHFFGLIQKFLK